MASEGRQPQRPVLKTVLYAIGLLGLTRLWGAAVVDGTMANIFKALAQGDRYLLPGSDQPMKRTYTGIWPVDFILRFFVIFFWQAVDGSKPAASATGVYFLGQIYPLLAAVYMDSIRAGQGFKTAGTSAWVFLYQVIGIGCAGSAWGAIYATTSLCASLTAPLDTVQNASLVSPQLASWLIPAITLGFAIPGASMAFSAPNIVSYETQQWAIVWWNIFPLNVFVALKAFGLISQWVSGRPSYKPATSRKQHMNVVRWVSVIAIGMGFLWHIAIVTISLTSVWFPALFHDRYLHDFHPSYLWVPPLLEGGDVVADGIRSFMTWDMVFGFAFVQLVMLAQLETATRFSEHTFTWAKAVPISLFLSFIIGPGTVMMVISWLRDEILFNTRTESNSVKKRTAW